MRFQEWELCPTHKKPRRQITIARNGGWVTKFACWDCEDDAERRAFAEQDEADAERRDRLEEKS